MQINTFGWWTLALCLLIICISATLSVEYIHSRGGRHQALLWLVVNMAAISLPAALLVLFALVK